MNTNSQNAIIYVTKLEAARRQLTTAIRMSIAGEDDLAIHTAATAARGILRNLLQKRGLDFFDDIVKIGLFSIAKEMAFGTLSIDKQKTDLGDERFRALIEDIADRILQHGGDVQIDDINSIIPSSSILTTASAKQRRYANLTKISNFLKHENQDPMGAIASEDVDNFMLIIGASAAHTMLSNDLSGEMAVFFCARVSY